MILKNFDSLNHFFDLENKRVIIDNSEKETIGWYKDIDEVIIALFAWERKLFLQLDDLKYFIGESCFSKIEISGINTEKVFYLYDGTSMITKFIYPVEPSYNQLSPFEYLDDDEFDWGLFLLNIINNPLRKIEFINNNA